MSTTQFNYNPLATCDDGTCIPVVNVPSFNCGVDGGCTDPGDGSGTYPTLGACVAAGSDIEPPPPQSYD